MQPFLRSYFESTNSWCCAVPSEKTRTSLDGSTVTMQLRSLLVVLGLLFSGAFVSLQGCGEAESTDDHDDHDDHEGHSH
eukprot:Skav211623  [mRNA]  locus=scaffold1088:31858:33679:+ [translate_table: standard]